VSETQYVLNVLTAGRPAGRDRQTPIRRFPGEIIQAAMHSNRSTMKDGKNTREGQSAKPRKNPRQDLRQDLRQDRLKLALRENLKRRKSQARGRDDFAVASSNADDVSPHDDNEKAPGK
jgi:hypothetical protein